MVVTVLVCCEAINRLVVRRGYPPGQGSDAAAASYAVAGLSQGGGWRPSARLVELRPPPPHQTMANNGVLGRPAFDKLWARVGVSWA